MKRLMCVLLILALMPCLAALADDDELQYYESPLGYAVYYPTSLLDKYILTDDVGGSTSEAYEPFEDGTGSTMFVTKLNLSVWPGWEENGIPELLFWPTDVRRLPVDEPPVEMAGISMNMHYFYFQTYDDETGIEMIILESPENELNWAITVYYVLGEPDEFWQSTFNSMIEEITFPQAAGARKGSFTLRPELIDDSMEYQYVIADEEGGEVWVYAESGVTGFTVERLTWDDESWTISGTETLYTDAEFTGREAVCIFCYAPEMLPELRIRGINADGQEEAWYIMESGKDGHMMLVSDADLF